MSAGASACPRSNKRTSDSWVSSFSLKDLCDLDLDVGTRRGGSGGKKAKMGSSQGH